MAQHVRREARRIDPRLERQALQHLMTAPPGQMRFRASRGEKITRRRNGQLPARQEIVAHDKVGFERLARRGSYRRQSLAAPFAAHMDEAFLVSHRRERQGHKLADTQARGVEHLHDAKQARGFRTFFDALARGIHQLQRFLSRKNFRQRTRQARRLHRSARIVATHGLAVQEAIKPAQGRQFARLRGCFQSRRRQPSDKPAPLHGRRS